MSNSHQHLIRKIHASPLQLAIAVTGGGSLAISDLLTEPGASDTVLEAIVPYGEAALCDFLGHKPEQSCSEKTARRMAMAAFTRALNQSPPRKQGENTTTLADASCSDVIGVGCTCSLASDRPKRGEHRTHWAVQSVTHTLAASVVFEKDARSRLEEERLVADMLIETIAAWSNGTDDLTTRLQCYLRPGETLSLRAATASLEVREVLFGDRNVCCIIPRHWPSVSPGDQSMQMQYLFPGSFDPMHRGHRRMVELLREKYCLARMSIYDMPIALEIAVRNVDKPPVDYIDLHDRITSIAQMPGMADVPVWLTRFPRFADKSDFFRGVTFVVGTDTLKRIAMGLYYQDAIASTQAAVERLVANGCRFLCYARRNADGELETAETLDLPDSLRQIVDFVPASEFCDDISSTQLRKNQG